MMMNRFFQILILLCFLSAPAFAQSPTGSNSDEPLEVTADGTLEWHRNEKKFIARKNAMAKQGEVSMNAATLTANYTESGEQNIKISRVDALDNVLIKSRDTDAYGDKGYYDLDKGYAELTGNNLKLVGTDQVVTARDRFEYWVTDGKLIAIGAAKITRRNEQGEINTLEADTITAYMKNNEEGERVLDRLVAENNVIITTPTEVLTGNNGVYKATTNEAEITGNVKITRGPNILEGAKATVDMDTSVSRMYGSGGATGRVKGVFFPGSEKKDDGT